MVEHQELGQAPLGRGTPGKQLTPRCRLQRGAEAAADGFVQGGVFGEVVFGGEFGEPEVEDGLRVHGFLKERHSVSLPQYVKNTLL